MLQKMITVLKGENYRGELSIKAYAYKYTLSDEMRRIYDFSELPLDTLPKGKKDLRISPMVVDLYLWALENPAPANMIVLSKNIGKHTLYAFKSFVRIGYSVALDYTDSDWLPTEVYGQPPLEGSALFLTSIFSKKRKRDYSC